MTDTELSMLMARATREVAVPTSDIVAGALARGGRLRRRRRVFAGLGSIAAVAVLASGSVWAAHSFGSSTQAVGPADDGPPSASASTSHSLPPHAPLATEQEIEARLRAALPGVAIDGLKVTIAPGRMVLPSGEQPGPDSVGVGFTIGGAAVGFSVDWPSAERVAMGKSVLPPPAECHDSHPMDAGCHANPDGSWIDSWNERPVGGVGTPASEVENYVAYWRTDGWRVYSSALNSTEEKGSGAVVAPHPPLTTAQLEQIATSGLWFD